MVKNFTFAVQLSQILSVHDIQLLLCTKLASPSYRGEWLASINNLPCYFWLDPLVFKLPNIFAQRCLDVLFVSVFERICVDSQPLFELSR